MALKKGDIIVNNNFRYREPRGPSSHIKIKPAPGRRLAFMYVGEFDEDEPLDLGNYEAIMNELGWFREEFLESRGKKKKVGKRTPRGGGGGNG